ncbi:DUF4860 domain-containing protein [Emergencia sp. JLR.KK010]|uniref:DUF4860 domain-containing protein n=1 Tax=Emergencia sp. JLR.KK010 TaxID=3114296 RepID=UPI0030D495D4
MKIQKNHLEGLIALLLFGVFAVCLLIALLAGADAYNGLTTKDRIAYDSRVCGQYIATQVRQNDDMNSVSVTDFGDGNALSLAKEIEGNTYVTLIYSYDGYLMELFCAEGAQLAPEDGEKIMPISKFSLSMKGSRLEISYGNEGTQESETVMFLTLRSGEEAAS